jgi:cell division protein FtsB
MVTRQRRQSRFSRLGMPAITLAFLGYFAFHAFHGYYGIWAGDRMEAEAARLSEQLTAVKRDRAEFERRVKLLRSESLDADLVDVDARRSLNRLRADEVVILMGAAEEPFN